MAAVGRVGVTMTTALAADIRAGLITRATTRTAPIAAATVRAWLTTTASRQGCITGRPTATTVTATVRPIAAPTRKAPRGTTPPWAAKLRTKHHSARVTSPATSVVIAELAGNTQS